MNITRLNELAGVVARSRGEVVAIESEVSAKISALQDELAKKTAEPILRAEKALAELEEAFRSDMPEDSKSVALAYGVIGLRKSPDSLIIENEDKVIAKLEGVYDDAIIIKKSVSKSAIKKSKEIMKFLGKLVRIQPGEEKFYADITPITADVKAKIKVG